MWLLSWVARSLPAFLGHASIYALLSLFFVQTG
jgi:hypothetical protein